MSIYGDRERIHYQFLTLNQLNYNKAMSEVRIAVVWLFGEIKTLKSQMKIGLSVVGKIYCMRALLQNARTCLYRNKVSECFHVDPPT